MNTPNEPLVSIIIPCYNQGCFLSETLQSIFDQTYSNWEALIIDDGSTDDTATVANYWTALDIRFKYFYKINGGLSDARNYGINISAGEYIQFLDSDDLIASDKLEIQSNRLKNGNFDITICTSEYFHDHDYTNRYNSKFGLDRFVPGKELNRELFEYFILDNRFPVSSPLIKREALIKTGLFDTTLTSLEDWDFWMRMIAWGAMFDLSLSDQPLTAIRIRNNSMSSNRAIMTLNRISIYNKLLSQKSSLSYCPEKQIRFFIKDNIKQFLFEINYSQDYKTLFDRLEQQSNIPFRYYIYKALFYSRLFPPRKILWIVFDSSLPNTFKLLKNRFAHHA